MDYFIIGSIGFGLLVCGYYLGRKDGVLAGIKTTFTLLEAGDFIRIQRINGQDHVLKISKILKDAKGKNSN